MQPLFSYLEQHNIAYESRVFPSQGHKPKPAVLDSVRTEAIEFFKDTPEVEYGLRPLPASQFGVLTSLEIGGSVVELAVLPPGPSGMTELMALTANPDRAVLLRWTGAEMPLEAFAEVPLDEDPRGLAVGLAPEGGARRCAVTLPGIDAWVLIGETPAGWAVLQEIATGDRPLTAARLDLDGDGTPELITADNGVLSRGLPVFRRAARRRTGTPHRGRCRRVPARAPSR